MGTGRVSRIFLKSFEVRVTRFNARFLLHFCRLIRSNGARWTMIEKNGSASLTTRPIGRNPTGRMHKEVFRLCNGADDNKIFIINILIER